ncbi:carboxypeptidase regulatory-like domain-containing protein [Silvibacterium acidisoli]|uniref:carboxypeptidase regulatory-like domain-containing protein n=1 Tax=Acidobacteriaceae bacterium ZG23-2 TaxID=2883246 RepID=UPI00406C5108
MSALPEVAERGWIPLRLVESLRFFTSFHRNLCRSLVFCALVLAVAVPGYSQATNGTINGTLSDQSGAVVVDAKVTLTNIGTSDSRTSQTNSAGFYQFINLPPGNYKITAEKEGYKQLIRQPVVLQVASTLLVDLSLAVGSNTQQVVVTSGTPLIQAESATLGAVVDQRQTTEMPLNGRNPMSLVALVPAVVPQGQSQQTPTGSNPFGWGNYQIGGGFANQSVTYLDGAPVNTEYINATALIPTQDSLQEFRVMTNNLPPDYGRLAGGAIQFRTKSGTNTLTGSAWEYIRNKVLNANTFFGNQAHLPNPAFTQNQFGFNVGGPVYIPHVYDGHNKTFFFVNWEGFSLRQGITYTTTVPTAAELTGNLSDLGTTIYDPTTTCGVAGGPACTGNQKQYDRQPFANATIPVNRLNPTALAYLKMFFPAPNLAAAPGTPNYTTTGSSGGNNYETVVHIDHNLSSKQHLSGRYTYWENTNLPTDAFNGICEDRCGEQFTTNSVVISDDYAFSSKTLLDVRVSYLRFVYGRTALLNKFDVTSIGQPAALQSQIEYPGPPVMVITGFDPSGIFNSAGADSTIHNATDDDRISGNLTKFVGNHTLTFGGEYLRATFNYVQTNQSAGLYDFTPGFTSLNGLTGGDGLGLASYMLGYPSGGNINYAQPLAAEQLYPAVYANDNWRIGSKLTLQLGVRWENTRPFTERHNWLSYFDYGAENSVLANAGIPNVPGQVGLVDSSTRKSRLPIDNDLMQFSPRVGLSYQAMPNTVFSAGYGIFWLPNDLTGLPYSDPVTSSTTNVPYTNNGGLTPAVTIDNPFPNGIVLPVLRGANFQSTLLGSGNNYYYTKDPYAYTQQFNAGVQQQIGNSFMFSIIYGGAKGTHLPIGGLNMDTLPHQDMALGSALVNNVANPYYGQISSAYSLGSATIPAGQLLLPFPEYSSAGIMAANFGSSTYHSLQLTAQQRFARGASINASYTWSKLISNADTQTTWLESSVPGIQDPRNLQGEKSLSANDAAQRLVVSYVYDLPVGHGQRFLANSPGWVNQIAGGWGVGGVTTLMSGFPLGFGTAQNLTQSFGGGSRPNYVSGCQKRVEGSAQARLNEWFNTACFAQPEAFTFGDEPRLDPQLRAAGVANWDASAYKTFPLAHSGLVNMQFRAEAFNLFNRVQFGYPGLTQGASNFGIVNTQLNNPRLLQFSMRFNY